MAESDKPLDVAPKRRLYVKTHGCQMNEYDSARMADLLADSHGYERVDICCCLTPVPFARKRRRKCFISSVAGRH